MMPMHGLGKMRFTGRSRIALFAAFAVLFGLGFQSKNVLADKKNNSVIVGMTHEPSQFNPILIADPNFEGPPSSCMFDTLWEIRPDGKFYPNLAAKVPTQENGGISPDFLTWKIELKKGVKWQDGKPFTASDVEFTYQQIMNPKNIVRQRNGFDQIVEFKVIDDHNIEFKLSAPFAPMYWAWITYPIAPKHALANVENLNTCEWNTKGTFGTGPFRMIERVAGSHIIFKRNPEYHGGPPKLETVILKFVPDQTVLYTQMKTGEIDVMGPMGIPRERYSEAQKLEHIDIMITPSLFYESLLLNCHKPYFQDKRVRQSIAMAIDREKIVRDVYYGTVKMSLSYLSPDHWAYNHNLKQAYDPQKASELLDSLGWKIGADGVREKEGVKLAFEFTTTSGNKQREQMQLLVQQDLKAIGIQANIKNLTPAVMWGSFFEETKYDMIFVGGPPGFGADPDYTKSMHSKRPRFRFHNGTPEMDKLLEEGVRTIDPEKRKPIYYRFQELFLEEAARIPIFAYTELYAKKKGLAGYIVNPYEPDIAKFIREWSWQ